MIESGYPKFLIEERAVRDVRAAEEPDVSERCPVCADVCTMRLVGPEPDEPEGGRVFRCVSCGVRVTLFRPGTSGFSPSIEGEKPEAVGRFPRPAGRRAPTYPPGPAGGGGPGGAARSSPQMRRAEVY